MTEVEWLTATDPWVMLGLLGKTTKRKERLCLVACCHAHTDIEHPTLALTLAAAERYADGLLAASTLRKCRQKIGRVSRDGTGYETAALPVGERHTTNLCILAATSAGSAGWQPILASLQPGIWMGHFSPELSRQLPAIIRCIFGHPIRPIGVNHSWLTSTAVAIAHGIYEDKAFNRLPILADALQDAGCEDADILDHCRGPGPHVRGCWVVDLVLGKQ